MSQISELSLANRSLRASRKIMMDRIAQLEATLVSIFENREVLTSDEWDSMERIFQRGMLGSASAKRTEP